MQELMVELASVMSDEDIIRTLKTDIKEYEKVIENQDEENQKISFQKVAFTSHLVTIKSCLNEKGKDVIKDNLKDIRDSIAFIEQIKDIKKN